MVVQKNSKEDRNKPLDQIGIKLLNLDENYIEEFYLFNINEKGYE